MNVVSSSVTVEAPSTPPPSVAVETTAGAPSPDPALSSVTSPRDVARAHGVAPAVALLPDTAPAAQLLLVRLGSSERLREHVVAHLRGRRSGPSSLITLPLLRAQLAELLTAQIEVEIDIESLVAVESSNDDTGTAGASDELIALHRRITDIDRELLRCMGAVGFLADGVGADAMQSERSAPGRGPGGTEPPRGSPTLRRRASREPLSELRELASGWGSELAVHAARLDDDPDDVAGLLASAPGRWLATAGIPPDLGPELLECDGRPVDGRSAVTRAVVLEELSRGDLGALLAAPGPSMAGVLVGAMGDSEQRERFFEPFLRRPSWACFALTEPEHGSDAASLETRLVEAPGAPPVLVGVKRWVGNAARAGQAVVFARHSPGPLGIGVYLVDTAQPGYSAKPLSTLGIRGAQVCQIDLDQVEVLGGRELGGGGPRRQRGLLAAVTVFDRLRPAVAAMALGTALSALDVLDREWGTPPPVPGTGWMRCTAALRRPGRWCFARPSSSTPAVRERWPRWRRPALAVLPSR